MEEGFAGVLRPRRGAWKRVTGSRKFWAFLRELRNERRRTLDRAFELKGSDRVEASRAKGFADALYKMRIFEFERDKKKRDAMFADLDVDESSYRLIGTRSQRRLRGWQREQGAEGSRPLGR